MVTGELTGGEKHPTEFHVIEGISTRAPNLLIYRGLSSHCRLTNLPSLITIVVLSGELTGGKTFDKVSHERLPHSAPATGEHRLNFGQSIYELIDTLFL